MVLVFFAGLTGFKSFDCAEFSVLVGDHITPRFKVKVGSIGLKVVFKDNPLKSMLIQQLGVEMYSQENNQHRLLILIACCAEAKNPAACRALSNSKLFHRDGCCINIYDSAVLHIC